MFRQERVGTYTDISGSFTSEREGIYAPDPSSADYPEARNHRLVDGIFALPIVVGMLFLDKTSRILGLGKNRSRKS